MRVNIRALRAWCAHQPVIVRSSVLWSRERRPSRARLKSFVASLALALSLSHCSSQIAEQSAVVALSEPCGNAEVEADEECDPAAEDWHDSCDAECHRTSYVHCEAASDCAGLNANCAAYTQDPGQQFCAPFCERDFDCPAVPGFEARCNFAWCALSCSDASCPHGMVCVQGQDLVDERGQRVGQLDVCVIAEH